MKSLIIVQDLLWFLLKHRRAENQPQILLSSYHILLNEGFPWLHLALRVAGRHLHYHSSLLTFHGQVSRDSTRLKSIVLSVYLAFCTFNNTVNFYFFFLSGQYMGLQSVRRSAFQLHFVCSCLLDSRFQHVLIKCMGTCCAGSRISSVGPSLCSYHILPLLF